MQAQAVCVSSGCDLHTQLSSISIYCTTRSRSISRDLGVTRFEKILPRTRIDALDIVSCRARPVDAPTAWNRREAPFWSRMATCTVTLRDGLTTRSSSCRLTLRAAVAPISSSRAEPRQYVYLQDVIYTLHYLVFRFTARHDLP